MRTGRCPQKRSLEVLVTHNRVDMDIPHEPGQRMTFRPLSGSELDEAERAATKRILDMAQGLDLSKLATSQDVSDRDTRRTKYDAEILIKYGVVAWSYQAECDEANKGQLDARTRDWARDRILDMNVRTEEEAGNSVASSTEGASLLNFVPPTISVSEA
jgi:hypothetical protein